MRPIALLALAAILAGCASSGAPANNAPTKFFGTFRVAEYRNQFHDPSAIGFWVNVTALNSTQIEQGTNEFYAPANGADTLTLQQGEVPCESDMNAVRVHLIQDFVGSRKDWSTTVASAVCAGAWRVTIPQDGLDAKIERLS